MKIEIIILILLFLVFFVWALWHRFTLFIIKRRYKQEDDKGRLAEEQRKRQFEGGKSETSNSTLSFPRLTESEQRELFQTTSIGKLGEDSNKLRETSKSNGKSIKRIRKGRNPFRRRKRN